MSATSRAITRISDEIKVLNRAQAKIISPALIVGLVSFVISCAAVYVAAIQLRSNQEIAARAQLLTALEDINRIAVQLNAWQKAKEPILKERILAFEILRAQVASMQQQIPIEFNAVIADEYFYRSEFGNAISYWQNISEAKSGAPISRELAFRELGYIAYKKINDPAKGAEWYGAAALLPVNDKHKIATYTKWLVHDPAAASAHLDTHFGK
jgi:hypothetical protein